MDRLLPRVCRSVPDRLDLLTTGALSHGKKQHNDTSDLVSIGIDIQPVLPSKPRGTPRVDDRRVLNGIFWVLRSGAPWRDLFEDPRNGMRGIPIKEVHGLMNHADELR